MANAANVPAKKARMELICELKGHTDRVWFAEWSPSGQVLASCGGDTKVRIWGKDNDNKWSCRAVLEGTHTRTVRSVSWSPDGKFLATCGFDGIAAIWKYHNGDFECIATLEGHENEIKSIAWSPTGSLIATCSRDKSVWIWEAGKDQEYECLSVLHSHSQDVKFVIWHPSGEFLMSCSYDDAIKIWNEEEDDWYCTETLTEHESTVWQASFDASGERFVSCSDDKSLVIWERKIAGDDKQKKWKKICKLPDAHSRTIFSVDWSKRNGVIASGGADDAVCLYAMAPDNQSLHVIYKEEEAHKGDVNGVRWHPYQPDLLASVGDDNFVKLWKVTFSNS